MSDIIFLFSLPRSGSTYLQRLLASNQDISTTSETWLLLPLFEVLFKGRALTEYNQWIANIAQEEFFKKFGVDRGKFKKKLVDVYCQLFEDAAGSGRYFLEKTPRNYLVINEILNFFPDSKFLFLWRDPADIALSLVRSYAGKWNTFFRYEIDFEVGIHNLVSASRQLGGRACNIQYKDIAANTKGSLDRIYSYLEFDSGVFQENELGKSRSSGTFGDKSHLGNAYRGPISRSERSCILKVLKRLKAEDYEAMGFDKEASIARVKSESVRFFEPRNAIYPVLSWGYRNHLAHSMHRLRGARSGNIDFGVE